METRQKAVEKISLKDEENDDKAHKTVMQKPIR